MVAAGPVLLSIVLVAFLLVAIGCAMEVVQLRRKMHADGENANLSRSGIEMRLWFHLLLLLGNSARAIALLFELIFFHVGLCPDSLLCIQARILPNLFFLTTYSLLTLFWAQLTYQVTNKRFVLLRPLFLIYNAVLFLAYIISTLVSLRGLSPTAFELELSYVLGAFYLVVLLFLSYFGSSVAFHFRSSSSVRSNEMLSRLVALCVLCAVSITVHVFYFLGSAMQLLQWSLGYPDAIGDQVFDSFAYTLLELGPSLAILFTMHRRKSPTQPTRAPATWRDPAQEPLRMTELPSYPAASTYHVQHTGVQPSSSPYGSLRDEGP